VHPICARSDFSTFKTGQAPINYSDAVSTNTILSKVNLSAQQVKFQKLSQESDSLLSSDKVNCKLVSNSVLEVNNSGVQNSSSIAGLVF